MSFINFKLKKKKILFEGMPAMEISEGNIAEVVRGSVSNIGDIVIRTDNDQTPFITIKSNSKYSIENPNWGNNLYGYIFRVLPGKREDYL